MPSLSQMQAALHEAGFPGAFTMTAAETREAYRRLYGVGEAG